MQINHNFNYFILNVGSWCFCCSDSGWLNNARSSVSDYFDWKRRIQSLGDGRSVPTTTGALFCICISFSSWTQTTQGFLTQSLTKYSALLFFSTLWPCAWAFFSSVSLSWAVWWSYFKKKTTSLSKEQIGLAQWEEATFNACKSINVNPDVHSNFSILFRKHNVELWKARRRDGAESKVLTEAPSSATLRSACDCDLTHSLSDLLLLISR